MLSYGITRACVFPPLFSSSMGSLSSLCVWILRWSLASSEKEERKAAARGVPSDAEEKERDARRDASGAEVRGWVRVYGRAADPLVRVAPYSYARRRWHASTRRTARVWGSRMRDAEACGRVDGMVVPWMCPVRSYVTATRPCIAGRDGEACAEACARAGSVDAKAEAKAKAGAWGDGGHM
jgi:hypothetical protein